MVIFLAAYHISGSTATLTIPNPSNLSSTHSIRLANNWSYTSNQKSLATTLGTELTLGQIFSSTAGTAKWEVAKLNVMKNTTSARDPERDKRNPIFRLLVFFYHPLYPSLLRYPHLGQSVICSFSFAMFFSFATVFP